MTVKEYLERKDILLNTTAIINDTGHWRLINGKLIPEKIFRKMFPLPIKLHFKKENPDNTRKFLDV